MTQADFDKLRRGDWVVVVQPPGRGGLRQHVGRAFKLERQQFVPSWGIAWRTYPFPSTVTVRSLAGAGCIGQRKPGTYKVDRFLVLEPIDCELPDRDRYPHQCLRCGAPAFIGIQVDCMNRCR